LTGVNLDRFRASVRRRIEVLGSQHRAHGGHVILILASLGVAVVFLIGFIWAVRSGQYEDTCTPALRILAQDESPVRLPPAPRPAKPDLNRS
jgi:cbb3-type cytochrome oxidase maturation protein